jgi:hypothetical protein
LIILTFRPVFGESPVNVRGAYFRICADATLRGPDNAVAASYCKGVWQLGHRQHRSFDCAGPLYLRVMHRDGRHERIGPYGFVKAVDGALFTETEFLGSFALPVSDANSLELWSEIALLPTA